MIEIALETGGNRQQLVRRALEHLGEEFTQKLKGAESILIKVDLVDHQRQLACTHVDAVRGALDVITSFSGATIYVGDAAYHGTRAAFAHFGYEALEREYHQVKLVDLNDDGYVEGWTVRKDGSKNPIRRSELAHNVDVRISLAPMKVHREAGVTLAVKNWTIGTWLVPPRHSASGMVFARWPWLHEEGPKAMHQSIMELYRQLPCDVAIIDGVEAMEGDGPTRGTLVDMGVVLAGMDAIAVDAVASTLMGFDPGDIGYLAMCGQEGLGGTDLTRMNVPPMQMQTLMRRFVRPAYFEQQLTAWRNE